MSSQKNRRPQQTRRGMKLMPRDIDIVRAVHDYRALTAVQLQQLFGLSRTPMQRRLLLLYEHEFLDRQMVTVLGRNAVNMPFLYTIGRRGVQLMVDVFFYDQNQLYRPRRAYKWRFVEHQLALNDVRIAVTLATNYNGWTLETWLDERVFRSDPEYVTLKRRTGKAQQKPVYPDAYFCLHVPQGWAHFFVELDRGIEPRKDFIPQIRVYEEYVRSGQYQKRYQTKSLRILVVTTSSEARLAALASWTESCNGDEKYWFALLDDISMESVLIEPIWTELGTEDKQPLIE